MSSQRARERILARLHASGTEGTTVPSASLPPDLSLNRDEKIERLAEMMTAMRTEIHIVEADGWLDKFTELAREKGWKRLLYGPGGPVGPAIETAWPAEDSVLPELVAYREPVETFKADLFEIDAGITSVRAGVADTGAVVLLLALTSLGALIGLALDQPERLIALLERLTRD